MLVRSTAIVTEVLSETNGAIKVETEFGPAIAYSVISGPVEVGDRVLLNRTANVLHLGTGGFDFVIAVLDLDNSPEANEPGHIVKLRYTPSQLAVKTIEEDTELAPIWDKSLDCCPVVVCQLHSQIAHAAAAAVAANKRVVYIMTDTAALPYSFSDLAPQLQGAGVIYASITAGQAFGGDYESVTVHSALLAAKHFLHADVIIVGQGPGNAGTGTKYGFGGIDQAGLLDIVSALSGTPIAAVRASGADQRARHNGISHHTYTTLRLVRSACIIPVPAGMINLNFDPRHQTVEISNLEAAFDLIAQLGIHVTTMGRDVNSDRVFFEAAAAAGQYASSVENLIDGNSH